MQKGEGKVFEVQRVAATKSRSHKKARCVLGNGKKSGWLEHEFCRAGADDDARELYWSLPWHS